MRREEFLTIVPRRQQALLIWLLIVLPFWFGMLNELLGVPRVIRYILDVAWILLLLMMLLSGWYLRKTTRELSVLTVLFLGFTAMAYLILHQSPFYYLWGVRNTFRMYAAFFAFTAFLMLEDAENYLKLLDRLFWINAAVSLVQYFVLGLKGDYLGGLFGSELGANAYTNIFFIIVTTKSILFYLEKKESTWTCMSKCGTALLVAVLAELKFFFIEVLLIIAFAVLITDFTWRKLLIVLGGTLAVVVGALTISILFPVFDNWFSLEWILRRNTSDRGYTSDGDLNRLNAIAKINGLWLKTTAQRLFGLGLGNCDTSSFAMFNTPFFIKNEDMHYTWMTYAHVYLECGWVGLMLYEGFFGLVFLKSYAVSKMKAGIQSVYGRIAMILSALCVLLTVYNNSLRTEAGYLMFFALALPFIKSREQNKQMNTM